MRVSFRRLALLVFLIAVCGRVQADIVTVTSAGNVGQFSSQVIVNGNPAISYQDNSLSVLRYVRAVDAEGATWNPPVVADATVGTGLFTSMEVVNGFPAIAYYDGTNGDLLFVRALDANGATWNPLPVLVDSGGGDDVGLYVSLKIVNGNPAISYYDATNQTLRYVRATDANGSTWGAPITVDTGAVGRFTSLAIVNGNPAISYYDVTNGDLMYVRATDASGTAWGTPISVDTAGNVGSYTSLAVVNGNPAVSYYDVTNGNLRYVRATDTNGSAWSIPMNVDVGSDVGSHTSLRVVGGFPAISYYDGTNQALKFTRALNADGSVWSAPTTFTVDTAGGAFTSLAVVAGNPAISYYANSAGDLKYARACDADGTLWLISCAATISVQFAAQTSSAPEAAGFGNLLRVTTSDGNPTATTVTLTIAVTGGTASPADYNLTGTITIPAATPHNSLVAVASGITVVDDAVVESNETVELQLSAPVGATLGAQVTTTHTILDDDTLPPQFVYAPSAGGTVTATGGTTIGSTGTLTITPSIAIAGAGMGAGATTSTTCTAPTAPFAGFGQTITAIGAGAIIGGDLTGTCTLGAAPVTQTLTCSENRGGMATARTWTLNCPAGDLNPLTSAPVSGSAVTVNVGTGTLITVTNPNPIPASLVCTEPSFPFSASPLAFAVPANSTAPITVNLANTAPGSYAGALSCTVSGTAQTLTFNLSGVVAAPVVVDATSAWSRWLLLLLLFTAALFAKRTLRRA
jgi:hypothetical protein